MRVGVDLDGVVRDVIGALLEHWALRTGERATRMQVTCYDLRRILRHPGCDPYALLFSPEVLLGARPYPGARAALEGLRAAGHEVVIVSRQPDQQARSWAQTWTCVWLPGVPVVLVPDRTSSKAIADCDVYLDDAPREVLELRARGVRAVVFDQPYNRELEGPRLQHWGLWRELVGGA